MNLNAYITDGEGVVVFARSLEEARSLVPGETIPDPGRLLGGAWEWEAFNIWGPRDELLALCDRLGVTEFSAKVERLPDGGGWRVDEDSLEAEIDVQAWAAILDGPCVAWRNCE